MSNGTPRSSSHSSPVATANPWKPPRSPLPPLRLAKLANALGVSTPLPAHHHLSSSTPNLNDLPSSATAATDRFVRSPTPSGVSTVSTALGPSSSRYLIHVVPPAHLQHPSSNDLAPPPSTPGYHKHFRRGVLVPLYPTLSAQMQAIAREYALPSSAGLLLYLLNSTPHTTADPPPEGTDAPGARISETIWKHIWARVLRVDPSAATSFDVPPSRSTTPITGLGITSTAEPGSASPALRPLLSSRSHAGRIDGLSNSNAASFASAAFPPTPAPSSPSSASDVHRRPSLPRTETDQTSPDEESLPLPGLHAHSLIPILAKFEFDVDRVKAGWYAPWARSRGKRTGSRARTPVSRNNSGVEGEEEERVPPLDLELVIKRSVSPRSMLRSASVASEQSADAEGYEQLEDNGIEEEEEEEESEVVIPPGTDPLADVFGTDEQTWDAIKADRPDDLALSAAALSAPTPDSASSSDGDVDEAQIQLAEVETLLRRQSRPHLQIETSPVLEKSGGGDGRKRASTSSTVGTARSKHIPPPLNLPPLPSALGEGGLSPVPSPGLHVATPSTASGGSTQLPYVTGGATPIPSPGLVERGGQEERDEDEFDNLKITSPEEKKRGGAVYEDLELGLDVSDFEDEVSNTGYHLK